MCMCAHFRAVSLDVPACYVPIYTADDRHTRFSCRRRCYTAVRLPKSAAAARATTTTADTMSNLHTSPLVSCATEKRKGLLAKTTAWNDVRRRLTACSLLRTPRPHNWIHAPPPPSGHISDNGNINPLESRGNYSATSNNTKLVHCMTVDGWVVTFGTARRGLSGAPARPGPSSLYQM